MPGPIPSIHSKNTTDQRPVAVSDGLVPRAPMWLSANAKKIYKVTSAEIVALGIAGKCDQNILAIFSAQMDRLQVVANINPRELTHERLQNDLTSSVLSLAKELGITPSARAKLRIARVVEDDKLDSLFED